LRQLAAKMSETTDITLEVFDEWLKENDLV
jgi:hypothetical protein